MKNFNLFLLVFCFFSAPLIGQGFGGSQDSVKLKKRFVVKDAVSLVGYNTYFSEGNGLDLPDEINFMDQRIGRSIQWGSGLVDFRLGLNGKDKVQKLGLMAGVRWNLSYYRLERRDFQFSEGLLASTDNIEEAIIPVDKEIRKHRILGNYISIPLMLDLDANPGSKLKGLRLSVGYVYSILLTGSYKLKYEDKEKIRFRDDFNLNPLLGKFEARVGYGPIRFYIQYGLDGLFDQGGPNVIPLSFGLVTGG